MGLTLTAMETFIFWCHYDVIISTDYAILRHGDVIEGF